jgi:hypothetical protein
MEKNLKIQLHNKFFIILSIFCENGFFEAKKVFFSKKPFLQQTAQNKEKRILLFDLRILSAFQIYLKYCKVPKSLDPTVDAS